ncbi:MAG: hypothetical protein WAT70_12155, partial [Rhizobiaceae bacterium]
MSRHHDPFAATDALRVLRERFAPHRGGPVNLNEAAVEWLIGALDEAIALSRATGNELSRLSWNRFGAPDPERVAAAMA